MNTIQITSISPIETAKNNRKFIKISGKPITYIGDRAVVSNQQPITRLIWDAFENATGNKFKGDSLFQDILTKMVNVGDLVKGTVVTLNTTPFQINSNTVERISVMVFDNEDATIIANRQLKNSKASVVSHDGVITCPQNLVNEQNVAYAE
jgi:hypothetical protein